MTVKQDRNPLESAPNCDAEVMTAATAVSSGKLLGRAQAARLLGVSKSTLRRMEGERLTPVVGPKNVRLFHEEQIHSLVVTKRSDSSEPMRSGGDVAADVFELLDTNVHPVDVVKRLRLEPELVEALHQRWIRLRAMIVLSENGVARLHRILGNGDDTRPTKEADLIAFAEKWVADWCLRKCRQCHHESAVFCRSCAVAAGLRSARGEARRHQKL